MANKKRHKKSAHNPNLRSKVEVVPPHLLDDKVAPVRTVELLMVDEPVDDIQATTTAPLQRWPMLRSRLVDVCVILVIGFGGFWLIYGRYPHNKTAQSVNEAPNTTVSIPLTGNSSNVQGANGGVNLQQSGESGKSVQSAGSTNGAAANTSGVTDPSSNPAQPTIGTSQSP